MKRTRRSSSPSDDHNSSDAECSQPTCFAGMRFGSNQRRLVSKGGVSPKRKESPSSPTATGEAQTPSSAGDHLARTQVRIVAKKPEAGPPTLQDFQATAHEMPGALKKGQLLLSPYMLSPDPVMCRIISEGGPLRGYTLSRVCDSRDNNFQKGDLVAASVYWQQYSIVPANKIHYKLPSADPKLKPTQEVPITYHLSVLGMPGVTAYYACETLREWRQEVVKGKKPEESSRLTFVVAPAAGAVGHIACQIMKRVYGYKVVGICGTQKKCQFLMDECGCDYAVCRESKNFVAELTEACFDGIDLYLDGVGSYVLDAVLSLANFNAHILTIGAISEYFPSAESYDFHNMGAVRSKKIRMKGEGFSPMYEREAPRTQAHKALLQWVADGKIRVKEDVLETDWSSAQCAEGLVRLFDGSNLGKQIVIMKSSCGDTASTKKGG